MVMLTTYADMLAAVKAAIESVPGAGKVLAEVRHCHTWTEFLDNFQNDSVSAGVYTDPDQDGAVTEPGEEGAYAPAESDAGSIQGWVIYGGPASPPTGEIEGTGIINRINIFTIRGISAVIEDPAPNGNAFRSVCEAVQNTLDGVGVATPFPNNKTDHVRMVAFDQRTFGSVLCHYCELVIGIHARYIRQY